MARPLQKDEVLAGMLAAGTWEAPSLAPAATWRSKTTISRLISRPSTTSIPTGCSSAAPDEAQLERVDERRRSCLLPRLQHLSAAREAGKEMQRQQEQQKKQRQEQ